MKGRTRRSDDRQIIPGARAHAAIVLAGIVTLGAERALALEEPPGEWDALKACEQKVCKMILEKKPIGDDLGCKVTKTWASSTIKGGESKKVKWGFGDARCSTSLNLSRADVIAALVEAEHTISVSNQTVRCEVEREGELEPVTAKASPRLEFKSGRADKVWINLEELDGPDDIKGTIWAAAKLEDTFGIFHKNMIKQINKFIYKKCNESYGPGAAARAEREERRAKAKKAREAKAAAAASAAAKASGAPEKAATEKKEAEKK